MYRYTIYIHIFINVYTPYMSISEKLQVAFISNVKDQIKDSLTKTENHLI